MTIVNNKCNINNDATNGVLTSWIAYTPVFVGYGTVSTSNFYSRRVGDVLEIFGTWTCGTPSGSTATITIGYKGVSANVSSDSSINANTAVVGDQLGSLATTNQLHVLIGASSTTMNYSNSLSPLTGNSIYAASGTGALHAKIPVTSWP